MADSWIGDGWLSPGDEPDWVAFIEQAAIAFVTGTADAGSPA
jgi:hypothetical protein